MDEILTPVQVAGLLRIHVKTVYRLACEGVIPGNRIGRSWRFSKTEILNLVSSGIQKHASDGRGLATAGQVLA